MPQSPSRPTLRLGTRGSKLARAQADAVIRALKSGCGVEAELVVVRTSGDRFGDRPLADLGGKGLFTKELEEALQADRIDLAVHSMKDVPTALPSGLVIGAVLPREDPRDAFVSSLAPSLETLPAGARIATGSVRRTAQIARARPDLAIVPLRGNVDTRLGRLDAGEMDAMVLAYAGLRRLGLGARATALLATESWLPALAQGALGIEIREGDGNIAPLVAELDHEETAVALACERAFQDALDGSCRTPIAGLANFAQGRLTFRGEVLAPDGSGHAATSLDILLGQHARDESAQAGRAAALELRPRAQHWLAK